MPEHHRSPWVRRRLAADYRALRGIPSGIIGGSDYGAKGRCEVSVGG